MTEHHINTPNVVSLKTAIAKAQIVPPSKRAVNPKSFRRAKRQVSHGFCDNGMKQACYLIYSSHEAKKTSSNNERGCCGNATAQTRLTLQEKADAFVRIQSAVLEANKCAAGTVHTVAHWS